MAILRAKKRPDWLITVTFNPKWKELKEVLRKFPPGTSPNDIPTLKKKFFDSRKSIYYTSGKKFCAAEC